jgi:type II secretory pathway pseudopilin PulG
MPGAIQTRRTAFTLIELIVIIIVIGILAALVIPQFGSAGVESRGAALATDLQNIRKAAEVLRSENSAWPSDQPAGTMPSEFSGRLPADTFSKTTAINGQYWWWNRSDGCYIGIATSGSPALDRDAAAECDRIIDDGDITTGLFKDWGALNEMWWELEVY